MAQERGKKSIAPDARENDAEELADAPGGTLNTIPEVMRRVVAAGLSGFFLTEEAIRRAFGDSLPKEWTEFATQQSDRARSEFFERLSAEIGRTLENVDVAEVLAALLAGRTVEVKAEIRLRPDPATGPAKRRIHPKGRSADDERG